MEPIAAFPGLTSVATSEMLSQLTIDQSLEKGGIELLPSLQSPSPAWNWFETESNYSGEQLLGLDHLRQAPSPPLTG